MAIVVLKKLTLCGLHAEKDGLLEKLQTLGGAHLITLNKQGASTEVAVHKQTEKAVQVLKYLSQCAKKRHQVSDREGFDLETIILKGLNIQAESRELSDQRDFLINRIEEVKPWGDFRLAEDTALLAGIKCWFYIIPKRLMKQINDELIYQVVHEDNIHCYTVVLAEHEPSTSHLPVPRTHTGQVPLSQLKHNLQAIELALEDKQAERESLTRWMTLMTLSLLENKDDVALNIAKSSTRDDDDLFAIQAWIPAKQSTQFADFAEQNRLAFLIEELDEQDKPPTLLENPVLLAGGEEVIKFYQTPAYHAWDPSVVVFFSFALFFSMILSDAGYAAVFAILLAFKWKKLGRFLSGKRLRVLALVTIAFSLLWGVLTGGYFGYSPPEESLIGQFKILDINDFDSMMHLSIMVGAIHIVMANIIKAYQIRGKKSAFAALGWVSLVIGGVVLWLAFDGTQTIAHGFLLLGGCLVLFFSSDSAIQKPTDLFWQLLEGIKNMTAITKIFGDILSYMRLFALGLASASLALTFNQLAEQVYLSVSGLGLLLSLLILILGHTLNLMLCLMSGVVHGLRLNFIEFYNWSVSDEGYPFKPFSKTGDS